MQCSGHARGDFVRFELSFLLLAVGVGGTLLEIQIGLTLGAARHEESGPGREDYEWRYFGGKEWLPL